MYRRLTLIGVVLVLGWGLWASSSFQTVAAGVAVFLFGMIYLEEGFTAFTGGALERVLARSTSTLPRSMRFGFISTTLMQSSSLVSVLTISFLSAGLLGLREGVGIIFGANIGTTTGAWLMAAFGMKVKISAYAMPMLVFGLLFVLQKSKQLKGLGNILAGIGFLFLGIHFMKEGFETAQSALDLAQFALPGLAGLAVFSLMGVIGTVVMQSSHATLMLIIAALATGQITYDNALALAIGANVGTTITAVLGSLSANAEGKRLAAAHLIFNVATGLVAVLGLPGFRIAVDSVSAAVGIAADDWTLKLAVFHTLFNVAGVVLLTPFVGKMVSVLENRFEGKSALRVSSSRYLNEAALALPGTALNVLTKEAEHLFDNAFELLAHSVGLHRADILSEANLEEMLDFDPKVLHEDVRDGYYRRVKTIYNDIIDFAARAQERMNSEQLEQVYSLRIVCRNVAHAVKAMTIMAENIKGYAVSDNEAIKAEYRSLRLHIARLLRRLYAIRTIEDGPSQLMAFVRMQERITSRDLLADDKLDQLVREQAITSVMATSLMNDSVHANVVTKLLLEAGERLFVARGTPLGELTGELLTSEEPRDTYDETLNRGVDTGTFLALGGGSLTGEMRRIERGSSGQEEEDRSDR
jgi:phosphate:Na+ symporter